METIPMKQPVPSMDAWLREAKAGEYAEKIGMYLTHNGVVRRTARTQVRQGMEAPAVKAMVFSYDPAALQAAVDEARAMPGIYYVRVWLNEGTLKVGDELMYVLIGGDIRPHVVDALQSLVERIKSQCVTETELLETEDLETT